MVTANPPLQSHQGCSCRHIARGRYLPDTSGASCTHACCVPSPVPTCLHKHGLQVLPPIPLYNLGRTHGVAPKEHLQPGAEGMPHSTGSCAGVCGCGAYMGAPHNHRLRPPRSERGISASNIFLLSCRDHSSHTRQHAGQWQVRTTGRVQCSAPSRSPAAPSPHLVHSSAAAPPQRHQRLAAAAVAVRLSQKLDVLLPHQGILPPS